jgi:hypothetical protein
MTTEQLTRSDLEKTKEAIILEFNKIITTLPKEKDWLKSNEAQASLRCSRSKLFMLRNKKVLECTKIGGTIYYSAESVSRFFKASVITR